MNLYDLVIGLFVLSRYCYFTYIQMKNTKRNHHTV